MTEVLHYMIDFVYFLYVCMDLNMHVLYEDIYLLCNLGYIFYILLNNKYVLQIFSWCFHVLLDESTLKRIIFILLRLQVNVYSSEDLQG